MKEVSVDLCHSPKSFQSESSLTPRKKCWTCSNITWSILTDSITFSFTKMLPPSRWCHDKDHVINHYRKRPKKIKNNNFSQEKNDGLTGIRIQPNPLENFTELKVIFICFLKNDFCCMYHLLSTNVNSVEKTSHNLIVCYLHMFLPFLNTEICGTIKYLEHLFESFPDNNSIILIYLLFTEPINLSVMKRSDRSFYLPTAPLTLPVQCKYLIILMFYCMFWLLYLTPTLFWGSFTVCKTDLNVRNWTFYFP